MNDDTSLAILEMFRRGREDAVRRNLWGRVTVMFKVGAWEGSEHSIVAPASSFDLSYIRKPELLEVVSARWVPKPMAMYGRIAPTTTNK